MLLISLRLTPNPSPKERGLKRVKFSKSEAKVLSFGEDLGEANEAKLYKSKSLWISYFYVLLLF
jgi:hypothetical protein